MRFITQFSFRSAFAILASLAALTIAVGCSGGGSAGLSGAHFDIPYYPGAKVTERDTGGFQAGDSFSSLESYDYVSWSLSTDDPMDKVVAFYTSKFPEEVDEAKHDDAEFATEDGDDAEFTFTSRPEDARPDDHVEITISPGKIEIMEVMKRR